jgi:geranylgeranyl diphosphate synthase type I
MNLQQQVDQMLPEIESELQQVVAELDEAPSEPFHAMLTYHMGWSGDGAGPLARGKRIRPLLVLMTAAANGQDWHPALPAAACTELIHNFSLVHDDIQDASETRRGRPTVWKQWGIPQAINAGDGLFVLANLALARLEGSFPDQARWNVIRIVQHTCLELTRGQFLDMAFETRSPVSIEDYWRMITGKTAALLSACCEIGALLGGAQDARLARYRDFGHYLGLAFQVQDDFLGIWGSSDATGKSTISDLVTGKKSLPVLLGLQRNGHFAERWARGRLVPEEAASLADLLAAEGVKLQTQQSVDQFTDLALNALREAMDGSLEEIPLFDLATTLLGRER